MNKSYSSFLIGALVLLQIFSLIKIYDLQSQLNYTSSNIQNRISDVQYEISDIYGNIDNMLTKQASIISIADYKRLEFDTETLTIPINFQVTPKTLTEDTTASLVIEGEEFPLEREGSTFSATIQTEITDVIRPSVIIKSDGVEQIEELNIGRIDNLDYVLPSMFNPNFGGTTSYTQGDSENESVYSVDGSIIFDVKTSEIGNEILSTTYLIKVNDDIVLTNPIELADKSKEWGLFDVLINQSIPVDNGDKVEIWVVGVDSLGFRHEQLAFYEEIGGQEGFNNYYGFTVKYIYAPNGELVYKIDEMNYERVG